MQVWSDSNETLSSHKIFMQSMKFGRTQNLTPWTTSFSQFCRAYKGSRRLILVKGDWQSISATVKYELCLRINGHEMFLPWITCFYAESLRRKWSIFFKNWRSGEACSVVAIVISMHIRPWVWMLTQIWNILNRYHSIGDHKYQCLDVSQLNMAFGSISGFRFVV